RPSLLQPDILHRADLRAYPAGGAPVIDTELPVSIMDPHDELWIDQVLDKRAEHRHPRSFLDSLLHHPCNLFDAAIGLAEDLSDRGIVRRTVHQDIIAGHLYRKARIKPSLPRSLSHDPFELLLGRGSPRTSHGQYGK